MERRFSGEAERQLCAEYVAGATVKALADKHDTELVTVSRTLERNGIPRRGASGRKKRVLTAGERTHITSEYQLGKTVRGIALGLGVHYSRVSRVLAEEGLRLRPRSWKGGRTVTARGYVQVRAEDEIGWAMSALHGYVMEHRLVMAQNLGRPLADYETVHHINGVKTDNRLENLQLRIGPHGAGVAYACQDCGSHRIGPADLAGA